MMGVLRGRALVLHEQNSVAGMANRILAGVADRVFSAFPQTIRRAEWVGNPLRAGFMMQPHPAQRFAGRSGPLRLLVVGGSLGARALNDTVPQALALLPAGQRPQVIHQSGEKQIDALRASYAAAGVQADLVPFIDDTAKAFADADFIVCRAGASTVTEIAAVGAAALFVPYPHAVDDHQTTNARFLVDAGAAWMQEQTAFTPDSLAQRLQSLQRDQLLGIASRAKQMEKTQAVAAVVDACEQLAKVGRA
jgi:UDP-N-acetylglucosamine--N-acetylmuramyl-(pentapeptide) pyrophosphoryl-undecaprenol N-acetylglucosamine transferase